VLGVEVTVHADHGHRGDAVVPCPLQFGRQGVGVERAQHRPVGPDPLVGLDHSLVEQLGQHDVPVEDAGPVLVADLEGVPEALRDDEDGALALAFEQGVGGHCRAHPHLLDEAGGDRARRTVTEQLTDPGHGCIGVPRRVVRQQLVRQQTTVGTARHDVGERPATVHPELPPSVGHRLSLSAGLLVVSVVAVEVEDAPQSLDHSEGTEPIRACSLTLTSRRRRTSLPPRRRR
jgi:hypothetical protein